MRPYKGIFIIASLFCSATFAGTESSGGGGAVVCRDANKNITFAQLYDIYEANTLSNYGIISSSTDPNVQLKAALDVLKTAQYDWLESVIMSKVPDIVNAIKFLPDGVVFAPPEDLGLGIVIPAGCEIEGVGYYDTNGVLHISTDIYAAFSNTDRAAFFLHEAIYYIDRTLNKATTSTFSRSGNAALFAPNAAANSSIRVLFAQATSALAMPTYAPSTSPLVIQGTVTSAAPFPDFNIQMSAAFTHVNQFEFTADCVSFWDENQSAVYQAAASTGSGGTQSVNVTLPDNPGCNVLWVSGWMNDLTTGETLSNWQLQVTSGAYTIYSSGSSLNNVIGAGIGFWLAIPHINIALPTIPTRPPD